MRIFLFIMCAAVMSSVSAQNPVIYPYNPDANNDSQVSTSDMLETLSVFGGSFLPNEILIDNTPLEEFLLVLQAQVLLLTDQATAIADLQSTIASLNADLDAQNLEVLNLQSQVISNYMIAQADNDALEISLAAAIANLQAADATLQTNIDNAVPQNLMNFNDMIMYSDGFLLDLTGHINMMGHLNADFIDAMDVSTGNLDVWGNSYLNGDVSTGNLNVGGTINASDIANLQAADATLQTNVDVNASDIANLQAADATLQTNVDVNASDIANLQAADATLQTNIDNAVPQNLMNFNNMIMYSDGIMLDLTGHINMMGYLNADFIGAMGGLTAGNLDVWGNSYLNGDVSTGNLDVNGLSDFWGPMHQYGVILH